MSNVSTSFMPCFRVVCAIGDTRVRKKAFSARSRGVFPKDAHICVVSHQETPVAAGFLYGFRSSLEIPWAASDKRFNKLSPNMLLYGKVLEYACEQGFQLFDFSRSSPDSGTYRFKEQWGLSPISSIGTTG